MSQGFDFEHLVELCRQTHEETRQSATRAVDHSLVVRNWLFGWYIVEYEQNGVDRAEYGARTLENLSAALKPKIGRGFSIRSLEQIRRFYLQFGGIEKTQTLSAKFTTARENLSVALRSVSTTLLQHRSARHGVAVPGAPGRPHGHHPCERNQDKRLNGKIEGHLKMIRVVRV